VRPVLRPVFVLWICLAAGVASAQGAAQCARIEQQLATKPLAMLGFLGEADCLGGAKDDAPVAARVRQRVPDGPVPREQLGEVPHLADSALAEISAYVAGALPQHGPSARELLAALANEIAATRTRLAQRLPLGEHDVKGWEWDGITRRFRGLAALDVRRLDVECAGAADIACRDAAAAGKVVFRAAGLVRVALRFSQEETYQQALDAARMRDAQWTYYFDTARLQFPCELYLNGQRHARANRKAGGFAGVPNDQWIVLHPGVGLEYVRDAPRGSRFEPALVVELVGYNRWRWNDDGSMGRALGVSLIQTFSDRAGLDSARTGVMLHYDHKYSLAVTRGNGETGVMLSIDLSRLVSRVEDDARSKFRLLGSGRGVE
jgi:hypothetical protein